MRKAAIAFGTSVFVSLVTALPALADSSLPGPDGPSVLGESGQAGGGGGTAFTGSNLTPLMIALAVVVVVGFSLLAYRQRRTVTS